MCCCKRHNALDDIDDGIGPIEVYTKTVFPMKDKPEWADANSNIAGKRIDISADDFRKVSLLGKGTFGKVFLVQYKNNSNYYAMKMLSKKAIRDKNQELHTIDERILLERVNYPFLVQMHYAFQDADYLYLILDFAQGGELFYHVLL